MLEILDSCFASSIISSIFVRLLDWIVNLLYLVYNSYDSISLRLFIVNVYVPSYFFLGSFTVGEKLLQLSLEVVRIVGGNLPKLVKFVLAWPRFRVFTSVTIYFRSNYEYLSSVYPSRSPELISLSTLFEISFMLRILYV